MSASAHARVSQLAGNRTVHRAFRWFHLHQQQLRRWHLELLRIPAPPFGEQLRAAWFLKRFGDLGLANAHIDGAGNAIAELTGADPNPGGPLLLLSAHLDTVFPGETRFEPMQSGQRILAPGACDNGAGLTALLALAAALRRAEIIPR